MTKLQDLPADGVILVTGGAGFVGSHIGKLRAAGFSAPFHTLESGVKDYIDSLC